MESINGIQRPCINHCENLPLHRPDGWQSFSSISQAADQPESPECCCQTFGSYFMEALDCLLTPFRKLMDLILWVVCCKRVADEFSDVIIHNLPQISASLRAKKEAKDDLKLGMYKFLFTGTEFQDIFEEELIIYKIKDASERRDALKAFQEKHLHRMAAFDLFTVEAKELARTLDPERIFEELSILIMRFPRDEVHYRKIDAVLTKITKGDQAKLYEFDEDRKKMMTALKEDSKFRALVIEGVLQPYLRDISEETQKFPNVIANVNKFETFLKDTRQADPWVKDFLEMVIGCFDDDDFFLSGANTPVDDFSGTATPLPERHSNLAVNTEATEIDVFSVTSSSQEDIPSPSLNIIISQESPSSIPWTAEET